MPIVHRISERIDLSALHQLNPARYPYLLQSAAQTTFQNHFDILFACPRQILVLASLGNLVFFDQHGVKQEHNTGNTNSQFLKSGDFLSAFEDIWRMEKIDNGKVADLPFTGGWFLFLGYELAQQIESSLELPNLNDNNIPVALATRIPAAVIVNRQSNDTFIVAESEQQHFIDTMRIDISRINNLKVNPEAAYPANASIIKKIQEEPAQSYIDGVKRVKRYIKDGDVFQVNLSRSWNAEMETDINNTQIYRRLMQSNPAPFSALAAFGDNAIISSSPERLVRVSGNYVETRPIAGTRPRGETVNVDQSYLRELIGHPKERAEHIMLIDLERNDLGRVCVPGSVKVNELMTLESYAHVHHIVSNIQGELKVNTSPADVIRAVFPGGTITGCPKIRCMEIIAELEQVPRGAYTGSLGYVNHDGSMDLNILIRTLVRHGDQISLRAGAGIVADSDPEKELQETRAKAKGMLLAL